MDKKKTRPRKASGDDARKQAVKPELEGPAAVEDDTPHLRTTTSAGRDYELPPEGEYTLAYDWNAGSKKAEPVEASSQLPISWRGQVGTIDGYEGSVALDYKGIASGSAADGATVKFYCFEEAEHPGNDESPNVWELEVTPRAYETSTGSQELCTVGCYPAGRSARVIMGLATRDK
jgi:hypothetical protein